MTENITGCSDIHVCVWLCSGYLNFKEKFEFLPFYIYDTLIRKNKQGMTKFYMFKVVLAFP